jgi:methylenetetrahydrofolate reductase (NADPH)
MKIIDILEQASEPLISYEIIPPLRGKSAFQVYRVIDELIEFNPPFIDVTSHAADSVYLEQQDGTFKRKIQRKRPGSIGLCAAIKYRYKVEAVPHLLCRGFSRQESEDALIELNYLGVDNVLAVTGDGDKSPISNSSGRTTNKFSLDLVEQIKRMNQGQYEDDIFESTPSDFCVGVGAYPEKHPESPNLEQDIRYLKKKVKAGADYLVTQMFFDNSDYFRFVDLCRANEINVPIIPGIKLITKKNQITSLPKHFSVNIPDDLAQVMINATDQDECVDIGLEFALKQCEALMAANVPVLHFYVMQDVKHVKHIVSTLKKY